MSTYSITVGNTQYSLFSASNIDISGTRNRALLLQNNIYDCRYVTYINYTAGQKIVIKNNTNTEIQYCIYENVQPTVITLSPTHECKIYTTITESSNSPSNITPINITSGIYLLGIATDISNSNISPEPFIVLTKINSFNLITDSDGWNSEVTFTSNGSLTYSIPSIILSANTFGKIRTNSSWAGTNDPNIDGSFYMACLDIDWDGNNYVLASSTGESAGNIPLATQGTGDYSISVDLTISSYINLTFVKNASTLGPAPTNLQINSVTNSSITLSWTAVANATSYRVETNNTVLNAPIFNYVDVNTVTATITDLQSVTQYYIMVRADINDEYGTPAYISGITGGGTISVTFRYTPSQTAIRSFIPGSFNNWGPNNNGVIAINAVSLLTVDNNLDFNYKSIDLIVGGGTENKQGVLGYTYKFHEHLNNDGTVNQWLADPLNPITVGNYNDSFINIVHPLIFQMEPFSNSIQQDDYLIATVASLASDPIDLSNSYIKVNGTIYTPFITYYNTTTQLLNIPSLNENLSAELSIGLNTIEIGAITINGITRNQVATFTYIGTPTVIDETRPVGLEDGITYYTNDSTKITFSLYAPGKNFVHIIGDHSEWLAKEEFLMKRDGDHFWLTVENFIPGNIYRFQYVINGKIRVADLFSELVLHPNYDSSISNMVYPNMPLYPTGLTTEIVSVIEPGKTPFTWLYTDNFIRPQVDKLLVYELLIRDFVEERTFTAVKEKLDYLQGLGVNVIELMPVSEFDTNNNWGYSPIFQGSLDKSYGTREAFKEFIDEAHNRGIAVVLDVVYNHAHGDSPLIRIFGAQPSNDFMTGNPLLGPEHAYNVYYHLNHDHAYIKYWLDRMNRYWLETYRVDGFRFDLAKGFASNVNDRSLLDGFNSVRINNLKRMYNKIREYDSNAYIILELLGVTSEEKELGDHGMLLWGNHNYNYSEGVIGYNDNGKSDMSLIYFQNRNLNNPHLIGYMESHDEQWMMRKARLFGNSNNYNHNIKNNLDIALQRMKLAGAFFFTIPGPKMLWQFGELGYGWDVRQCLKPTDGTDGVCLPDDPDRIGEKPVRWDYYQEQNRRNLYNSWSKFANLRASYPIFTSRDTIFTSSLIGETKWIHLVLDNMKAVIIGNFGVFTNNMSLQFPSTGTWYDYVTGNSITLSELDVTFRLAPGEFRIYTSEEIINNNNEVFFVLGEQDFGAFMGTLEHNPVEVNLDIQIDASGSLRIFSESASTPSNIIDASENLAVSALYVDASNSFFEFQELSTTRGEFIGELATHEGRNYRDHVDPLVNGLQGCLTGTLDASGASPFNLSMYDNVSEYKEHSSFGELALAVYAHYMFGHVAATAAITNDVDFVNRMDSSGVGQIINKDGNGTPTAAPDNNGAYLAHRLVAALINTAEVGSPTNITKIVRQVLGQDASRAMDQDNNQMAPDAWHELKFIPGDVIYMKIKLTKPDVIIGTGQNGAADQLSQAVLDSTLENKFKDNEADVTYTIKITLKANPVS
jgi:glycosidase